jgi:hypothetical protein
MFLISCASDGINKDTYNQKIRTINLGMTKDQFYKVFPEAVPRGAKNYPSGIVEVLEVNVRYYSFHRTGNPNRSELTGMEWQAQWFYFFKNQLIQYGQPNDWPSDPDKIIEIRSK